MTMEKSFPVYGISSTRTLLSSRKLNPPPWLIMGTRTVVVVLRKNDISLVCDSENRLTYTPLK
jgi:hypothetical protein